MRRNECSIFIIGNRNTSIIPLFLGEASRARIGRQQVFRKYVRSPSCGTTVTIYEILKIGEVEIGDDVYNMDLREIQQECPSPSLVIFTSPLNARNRAQSNDRMTVHNIGTIFRKDKSFWEKSIFVITISEQEQAVYQKSTLKKQTDTIKSYFHSRSNPPPDVVSISDNTKDPFLPNDKRSFWVKVLDKCERTSVVLLAGFLSQHKTLLSDEEEKASGSTLTTFIHRK